MNHIQSLQHYIRSQDPSKISNGFLLGQVKSLPVAKWSATGKGISLTYFFTNTPPDYMTLLYSGAFLAALTAALLAGRWVLHQRKRRIQPAEDPGNARYENGFFQSSLLFSFGIVFLVCVILSTIYYYKYFLPSPSASPATAVVPLFVATTVITGLAFFATQLSLFYFAWKYHQSDGSLARHVRGSGKLELVWTIIPAIAFIFLFVWGHLLWKKIITQPATDFVEIEVMAEQFNWKVRYAGADHKMGKTSFRYIGNENTMGIDTSDPASKDDFIPVQMHVPKNKPVKLTLRSKDVIHSFFVPLFGTKMDAVPGMQTSIHFTAVQTTAELRVKRNDPGFEYEVACAELCGRMHFAMKLILVVDEPDEYERWYREQKSWTSEQVELSLVKP